MRQNFWPGLYSFQVILLQYGSGTKRRPGISKNVVFIRAVESQVIRECKSTSRNQNQSQTEYYNQNRVIISKGTKG